MKTKKNIELSSAIGKRSNLDVTDLNGEKIMMNLERGEYLALNDVGSRIWEIIDKSVNVNDIINTLINEYNIDFKTCEASVMEFLGSLNNAELIHIN